MENTLTDTRPTFARLTEGRAVQSWRAAIPAVVVVVAFVALLAYLASAVSSSSQRAMAAERQANDMRDQQTGYAKQIESLQKDNAIAKSPGRTTVVLESADAKKSADGAQKTWATATWGELPDGKSFMRINAYGLSPSLDGGKQYHAWFLPTDGQPVDLGAVDVDSNGSGFTMGSELPGVDQGKTVELTADAQDSKQPGDVVAKADLPKLQPTAKAPPAAPAGQAKSGAGTQPMHQDLGK